MPSLIITLLIGAVAGMIDIIPMLVRKLDKRDCAAAFVHWILLGVVIAYLPLPLTPWLKGLVIAEAFAVPVVLMVAKTDKQAIPPILIMSAILGMLVGWTTDLLIAS